MSGQTVTTSAAVQVSGTTSEAAPAAVKPVTVQALTAPNREYEAYAATELRMLAAAVASIQADLRGGNLTAARTDWLAAQLDWEKVGASYDSFGDDGLAVDGLPDGLVNGVHDKDFTGLHRLEYGLWHGQSAASLVPVAAALAKDVATVQKDLTSADLAGDPTNLPIRAHEVLEDALRDHLSGVDDEGSGEAYPETYADLQVTRAVLSELAPLISARSPKLLPVARAQMSTLQQALLATREYGQWTSLSAVSRSSRQRVDGTVGALLETLSSVPDLLEVPPTH
jgi:high-affinity iron transporter